MRIGHRGLSLLVLLLMLFSSMVGFSGSKADRDDIIDISTRSGSGPGSSTVLENGSDFENGTLSNVRLNDAGEVELEYVSISVLDDYLDDSMISYMESAHLDTELGVIEQEPLMTFGSMYEEMTTCSIKTSDDGFLLAANQQWYNPDVGYDSDIHLVRFNNNGIALWNHTLYVPERQESYALCETIDGGYAIVGKFTTMDYITTGSFIIKMNSTGGEEWNRTYDFAPNNEGKFVKQIAGGGYLIAGSWQNTSEGGYYLMELDLNGYEVWNVTTRLSYNVMINDVVETIDNALVMVGEIYLGPSFPQVFAAKVQFDGEEVWNTTFSSTSYYDYFNGVVETTNGDLMICGQTRNWSTYNDDGWLMKMNADGKEIWNLSYDFQESEVFEDIVMVEDGFVVVGHQRRGGSSPDVTITKVNETGNLQWGKLFGGADWDEGRCIHTLGDGFFLGGSTYSFGNGGSDAFVMVTNSTGNHRSAKVISKNLMEGRYSYAFDQFEVISDAGVDKKIHVRFSLDGETWYNSQNIEGSWDEIHSSPGRIDLDQLEWNGSSFYYDMKLTSSGSNAAIVGSIRLKYTTFSGMGAFFAPVIDTGAPTNWSSIDWEATIPEGTSLEFQIRSSGSESNIATKAYLGPDGTDQTFYTDPGSISLDHLGSKCLQFKAILKTENRWITPALSMIRIDHNCIPQFIGSMITPSMGDVTDEFQFKVYYKDMDDDPPDTISLIIDNVSYELKGQMNDTDHTDGRLFSTNMSLDFGNHTVTFHASDGLDDCVTDPQLIFVGKGPLDRIEISGDDLNITTDDEVKFTANGYDAVGNQIDIFPLWDVSGGGTIDEDGLFIPTTPGNYIVYANFSNTSGSLEINIEIGALSSISISPMDTEITTDDEIQFSAMGSDDDGNLFGISPIWSVTGGGIIDENGLFTAQSPGAYQVEADFMGVTAESRFSILPGRLSRIEFVANRTEILTEEIVHLVATGYDNDSNVLDLDIELVSNGGSLDQNGFFTSMEPGIFNITAQLNDISKTVKITVLEREEPGPDDDDDDTSSGSSKGINWVLIAIPILIILLIIALLVVLLVMRSKGEKKEEENIEEEKGSEEVGHEEEYPDPSDMEYAYEDHGSTPSFGYEDEVPTSFFEGGLDEDRKIKWDEDLDE